MNKINKKKGMAILLSIALIISLAACAGTAQAQTGSVEKSASVGNIAAGTGSGALPSDGTSSQSKTVSAASEASDSQAQQKLNVSASSADTEKAPSNNSSPQTVKKISVTQSVSAPAQPCSSAKAALNALCGQNSKNSNACPTASVIQVSCNTGVCKTQICSKLPCNPSGCDTASCKAGSCKLTPSGSQGSATKPSSSGTSKTPAGNTPAPTDTNSSVANQVLGLINAERTKNGLSPLTMNANAQKAAQLRANEIVQQFSHTRPNGQSCFTALQQFNASYSTAGENIAYGQPDAKTVVNRWMNSPGHRANILNGNFKQTGIGVYRDSKGIYYWTQLFIG